MLGTRKERLGMAPKLRTFDQRDNQNAKRVAVVNQFAREFFPGEDVIGKSIQPDFLEYGYKPTWYEIVGVVAGIRTTDLTEGPKPQFFLPYEQASQSIPTNHHVLLAARKRGLWEMVSTFMCEDRGHNWVPCTTEQERSYWWGTTPVSDPQVVTQVDRPSE